MRVARWLSALALALAMTACNGNSTTPTTSTLPPPNDAASVPASVTSSAGYQVSVFAVMPSTSTHPDSLVQIGNKVFVGVGDDLNPDGTPGPSGKKTVEVLEYSLSGKLLNTFSVIGHNDGLMGYDSNTLWAMSNEDCNPTLVVIDIATGSEQVYTPQSSLVNSSGCLANSNGGLDDMQMMGGTVYVSASNPNPTPPGPCPANSSTPGCPNGVTQAYSVYTLSLNSDGKTFNLTPVLQSGMPATDIATNATGTLNMTDSDSEGQTPDGSTLLVDSQQDSELVFIKNPGASQSVSYLPLTLGGSLTAIDDTRYAPSKQTFMLDADTNQNYVYRIDAKFGPGNAYSSAPTQIASLNLSTGVLTPVVSGLQHPNGMLFVTAP